ncbi:MAG: hypothetical protein WCR46_12500 [Deltaproteobacteria bacterium]
MEWKKAGRGIRFKEHHERKNGIKPDRYFSIYYRVDGKQHEQGVGWGSEGMTVEKAMSILNELRGNQRQGAGPVTLKEKRELESARKKEEARQKAIEEKENISFIDFFENVYLPVTRTSKKPLSVAKEEQHVKNWIKPAIGNLPLKELKKQHIELIKNRLLEAGRTSRTVQYVLATIRQTWNAARFEGFVSGDSPTRSVKLPKVDNRRQRYLTPDECESLLTALKPHSEHVYFISVLSLDTGMRF